MGFECRFQVFTLPYINALRINNKGVRVEFGVGQFVQQQLVFCGPEAAVIRQYGGSWDLIVVCWWDRDEEVPQ